MKIIFTIKSIYKTKGGAEKVLALVASGLAARGHDISLLTYDAPNITPSYPLDTEIKRLFLNIGSAEKQTTWIEALRRLWQTRQTLRKQKPDIVISFMYSSYVLTSFALIATGIKLIGSEHIVPAYYRQRPLHFQLLLLSTFFMRRMTVVTEHIITLFPRWVQHKLTYAPNPVVLMDDSPHISKPTTVKILLNVGRMTAQKNQVLLIDAFALLATDFPDWQLRIVGDGELRQSLNTRITTHRLENRIALVPPTDTIEQEYRAADLFAMPSTFESFGLVTAEAMMCGLPVVGFAECPGTNEIIKHSINGLLVPGLTSAELFADALRSLMGDEAKRHEYGQKAKQTVAKYHLAPVLDTWEKLISEVTGR